MIQKRILEIKYSSQLQPLGAPNTRLTSSSMAELVVFLPFNPGNLYFTWITPGNVKVAERALFRDSMRDKDGMYAFSGLIYPNMTSGVINDTGQSIFTIRTGNLSSGIVRVVVEKSIVPETSEMPPSLAQDVLDYLNTLEDIVVSNKDDLDSHKDDKNNPHNVTAEQLNVYEKEHVDLINVRVVNVENDIARIDAKDTQQDVRLDGLDTRVGSAESSLQEVKDNTYTKVEVDNKDTAIMNKVNNLKNANMLKDVAYNNVNGVLTFTKYDDTIKEIDLPLELLVERGYYDEMTNELVLVLANASEIRIPVGDLLTDLDAHNIRFNGSGTNYLVNKLDVEGAIKELDTRVKANAEDIDLRQAIVKVNQTSLDEADLVYFMQTLEDGMYRIKTDLWGHELLFVSDMNLPVDPDAEEPVLELKKEYARYTSNGTSYRYDFESNDWVMSAGGGGGGGGGGEDAVTIQLTPVPLNFPLNFSHAIGTDLSVTVNFTHSELQFATLKILRGASEVETRGVNLGENVIDLTPHIRAGSNSITLRVTDGERSRSISYNITGVAISLTSTFNDAITYGANVDIPFRVQTEAQRKVYFTVDGVTETITNVQLNNIKSLTGLTHGVKEVEIQAAALIGEKEILSNKLRFNVIVSTKSSPALISSKFEITEVTRGSLISIDYIVYNPLLEFNETILKVDGVTVGTSTAGRQRQFWNVRNLDVGLRTLRIESAGVYKEFQINILPLDMEFENIEDGFLKLYLTAAGKSNSDIDKSNWENSFGSPLTTNLSNFNFASNGWIDESLVFNGNATISIPFKPFQNAVSQVGKTIELEFETAEGLSDEFIRCMHNNRGFIIYKDRAFLRSSNTQVEVFFKENEKIKLSFVINPVAGYTLTYVNGVMTGIDRMNSQTSFQQSTAQNIIVNDKAVDGKLYNVRVYDRALEHQEILQNYLYDIVSLEDKIHEHNFSDIFNQSGTPDIEKVKERMPVMVIRTYETDENGNNMPLTADFRPYVSVTYEDNSDPNKNFELANVRLRTQGTSSLEYPVKNYRLYSGDLNTNPVTFNNEMHPAIRINLKADYMESSMSTDPAIARLFNQVHTKPIPPKAIDGLSRTTIWTEGAIALFSDDGSNLRFEGVFNNNGDKGDNKQWGFYPELNDTFPNARRFEVLFNAENHAVAFTKNKALTDNEFLLQVAEGFESRWPIDEDDVADLVAAEDYVGLRENYGPLVEFIEFIGSAKLVTDPITKKKSFATNQDLINFKTGFEQRAEKEYFIKFLLTIFIFGMVDNFGKDLLLNTWGNEGGQYPKWYLSLYDLDSGVGIDNQGRMTDSEGNLLFDYNMEMEDDGVFAQASSKLWDAVIAAYPEDIKTTYAELRSNIYTFANIWKYLYTEQIATISKGMYNANALRKYIETPGSDQYLWMLNGDRINQMSRWITNRLAFLDSKYDYNTDTSLITGRLEVADTDDINFQVKSSIHQWITGQLGNTTAGYMKTRTLLGETATLNHKYASGTELPFVEFKIFSGQYITELVNFKDLPIRTLQIGNATQLNKLDLSKVVPSSELQSISFGDNFELTEVNLQNNSGLSGLLDLSGAIKLKKLDLRGTAITSVVLPNGGVLEELYLPNTITALEIRNQAYLETVNLAEGTKLEILILENTPVDYRDLFSYLSENGKVRILGVEMSAYGDELLVQIQSDLDGIGGIDSNGNYTNKPFMQGIIKILNDTNIDPLILEWFVINLADLVLETNIVLPDLVFIDEGDTITLSQYTGNTLGLLAIPNSINVDLSPENPIISGIDGWKPVTKINASVLANKSFTQIELPNNLIEIGDAAFQNSNNFTAIFIPTTVTTIGTNVFSGNNASLLILSGLAEAPIGWDTTWNSGNSTVIWGVRNTPTVFEFNTKGGDPISPIVARFLSELPTPTKFGANSSGWLLNREAVSLPIVPIGSDPYTFTIEVDEWIPWEYEVKFKLPDNTVHETMYVTYGDTLGSEFILIDKGGSNEPTYDSKPFGGWYTSSSLIGGTRLTSSYVINQNVLEDGYIVEFYGRFLDTRGVVFTYNKTDDVYDVTRFTLTDTSMADGSINLFIPATFDDGTNGEKYVRNVEMHTPYTTYKYKVGSIVIEENILTNRILPSNSFEDCKYTTAIEIPYGFTSVGDYAFNRCLALTSVTLPESLTRIGNDAFYSCTSLASITIPEGVTSIGNYAFGLCSSLTSITIPNSVTSISARTFYSCTSLASITIPEGVTSIGSYAFNSCTSLTSINLLPTTPPSLAHANAFQDNAQGRTFYIPENTYAAYSTATNWSHYVSFMEEVI